MKKLVLGALCIVLGFAANVTLAATQPIGESTTTWVLTDGVLTIGGTGAMPGFNVEDPPWFDDKQSITTVIIESGVTSIGESAFSDCTALESVSAPFVTSIGYGAFMDCASLKSVYAPSVTSIGGDAFGGCISLTSLTVNSAMKEGWDWNGYTYGLDGVGLDFKVTFYTPPPVKVELNPAANSTVKVYTNGVEVTSNPIVVLSNATVSVVFEAEDGYCFLNHALVLTNAVQATDDPTYVAGPLVVKKPSMSVEVAQQAEWGISLKSGDQEISPADYAYACSFYGLTQKAVPQVVPEGCVAVTKESIQAAKAETVEIVDGMVYLGVSVLSNSDITASTTSWAPVKFQEGATIYVTTDGSKLILPIPAPAQQGFMILHSGDIMAVPSGGTSYGDGPTPTNGDVEPYFPPWQDDSGAIVNPGAYNPSVDTSVVRQLEVRSLGDFRDGAHSSFLVAAVKEICAAILIAPGVQPGQGEVRIQLKADVLSGTEVFLEAEGTTITVAFNPATADVAEILSRNITQLQQHLAEGIQNYQIVVKIQ